VYIGHLVWGDISKENSHPPIVSKEQFDRVQQILDEATKTRTNVVVVDTRSVDSFVAVAEP